jgi:outer membrane biosynthesis protein TonB
LVVSYHLSEVGTIQEQVVPLIVETIAAPSTTPEMPTPTSTVMIESTEEPLPTETPTTEPTQMPTVEPLPTETPTTEPTLAPTATPEPTQTPTVEPLPSETPTTEPTLAPTATPEPTQMPTVEPTPAPTIPPLPTLAISADIMTGVAPLAVQFTSTVTDVTEYIWDFGDGVGVSVEANPVYTFAAPGTYRVTLTVSGVGGSVSASLTITVTE